MRTWVKALIGAGALAGALGAGYWFGARGHGGGSTASSSSSGPPAAQGVQVPVQTTQIERKRISESVTVYGRVVAQPGDVRVISVPFEASVEHVLVTLGQPVGRGTPLIRFAPSPATRLALQQAQTAAEAAARRLTQVQQEYDAHLAVSTQLIDAQKAAQAAAQQLSELQHEGAGQARTVTAQGAGVVSEISVRDGQLVQGGSPLVSVAVQDRVEARLGAEPEDAPYVHVGDQIALTPVHAQTPTPVVATVKTVAAQVDPKTQLIDIEASLPRRSGLVLGAYVRGQLTTAAEDGLVVPKAAVLPEGGEQKLFTVVNGRAVEHKVKVGVETDKEVQVLDAGLKPGDLVVTDGNYELTNGMAVLNRSGK